jgi:protein ImuB
VDRMACVNLPALPLQILLRIHPDWRGQPAAVVDRDKPQGVIQWVNERARASRILPGMRYAAGLALAHELRAGVVTDAMIADEVTRMTRRLARYSPQIEPSDRESGIFWVNASGLNRLYPSLGKWADCIQSDLWQAGFRSVVAVGFSKYGTYAASVSRGNGKNIVFESQEQEQVNLKSVPIDRLGIERKLRDALLKLGVRTSGGFLDLPAESVRKRFGAAAHDLHRRAGNREWTPLKPAPLPEPIARKTVLDYAETNHERLLNLAEPLLDSMLKALAERREALAALRLSLMLDDKTKSRRDETFSPAAPTLDVGQLLGLLRLRLESICLSAGVIELRMRGRGVLASQRQLELFREKPKRDLAAVHQAFAQIRAELGNDAVMRARLNEGHLPEAQFALESMKELLRARPTEVKQRPLTRRIFLPPIGLPSRARHEPDGWLLTDLVDGPVEETLGPHIVSGGWWTRETTRAYYYARTRSGRWLWVYNDLKRRRWCLHGEVE